MKKTLMNLMLIQVGLLPSLAFAGIKPTSAELSKFIPKGMSKNEDGSKRVIGVDLLSNTQDLSIGKEKALLVTYSDTHHCMLVVLRSEKGNLVAAEDTVYKFGKIEECKETKVRDLDGDNIQEVVVTASENGQEFPPSIFRWNGKGLVEISPVTAVNAPAFRQVTIFDKTLNKHSVIYDEGESAYAPIRIYQLDGGLIKMKGEYSFVAYASPEKNLNEFVFQAPDVGDYILDVKNVSDHTRSVRADITINGSSVLRSKMESYTSVHLSKSNSIKVKVYGRKDSVLMLTLVKK